MQAHSRYLSALNASHPGRLRHRGGGQHAGGVGTSDGTERGVAGGADPRCVFAACWPDGMPRGWRSAGRGGETSRCAHTTRRKSACGNRKRERAGDRRGDPRASVIRSPRVRRRSLARASRSASRKNSYLSARGVVSHLLTCSRPCPPSWSRTVALLDCLRTSHVPGPSRRRPPRASPRGRRNRTWDRRCSAPRPRSVCRVDCS